MDEDSKGWVRRTLEARLEGATAGSPAAAGLTTFIDQGADFDGVLRLRSDARIDADFKGEIHCEGHVFIGESAALEGNVRAREVAVAGVVVGEVSARRELMIRAGGRVHGSVETASLVVERGAGLNGTTQMTRPGVGLRGEATAQDTPSAEERPAQDKAASAEPAPAAAPGGPA